jgi:two-component system response regulator AtoC
MLQILWPKVCILHFRQICYAHMPPEKTRKTKGTERVDVLPPDDVLFGRSMAMQEVRHRAGKICGANVPVLLEGHGGTGKEVLARWIHEHSPSRHGQFVKVNCAAIPGTLLESELFGYEKGAFTGALGAKPGRVELAHNGTLFLDEIADLGSGLQSKLLQFLQDGRFSRIGGEEERRVETRLICATNKNLMQEIDAGKFRADLYYRINVVLIRLPRLCERREDIPSLAGYFLGQCQKNFGKEAEPLSKEMQRYLQNMDWPGNIRELSNSIARHVLMGAEAIIAQQPASRHSGRDSSGSGKTGTIPLKQVAKNAVRDIERNVILEALRTNQWNRRKTALALKISYRALIYKIRGAGFVSRKADPLAGGREACSIPGQDSTD